MIHGVSSVVGGQICCWEVVNICGCYMRWLLVASGFLVFYVGGRKRGVNVDFCYDFFSRMDLDHEQEEDEGKEKGKWM